MAFSPNIFDHCMKEDSLVFLLLFRMSEVNAFTCDWPFSPYCPAPVDLLIHILLPHSLRLKADAEHVVAPVRKNVPSDP